MKPCVIWTGSHLLSFLHFRSLLKYHFFSRLPWQPSLKEHWVGSAPYPVWIFSIVTSQLGCKYHEGRDFILFSGIYFQHQEQGLALRALSICWMAEWTNKQLCVLLVFSLKMICPFFLLYLYLHCLVTEVRVCYFLWLTDWMNHECVVEPVCPVVGLRWMPPVPPAHLSVARKLLPTLPLDEALIKVNLVTRVNGHFFHFFQPVYYSGSRWSCFCVLPPISANTAQIQAWSFLTSVTE